MTKHPSLPAVSRSAHAAIAGYEYQFDKTALTLLAAASTDVVEIEGIEDVDLHTLQNSEAVQVKYHSGQNYSSPKSVREPIRLMLEHYKTGARWKYYLHIHFKDFGVMPDHFNVDQLKECLTKKSHKQGLIEYFAGVNEANLQDFCSRLKLIRGDSFALQESSLIKSIAVAMKCDSDEVEAIYMAKVREFVHGRARSDEAAVRTVTRNDLIEWLSVREFLYDKWQMQKIGYERYFAAQKKKLRAAGFRDPTKERAIYSEISRDNLDETVRLCQALAHYLGRLTNAHPWTVIVHGTPDLVHQLKVGLVTSGVTFNDGHEDLEFQPKAFIERPIINTRGSGSKIERSSFCLRLVTRANFQMLDLSQFRISRFVSIGDEQAWMTGVAEQVLALRHFEPAAYVQLMEEIA